MQATTPTVTHLDFERPLDGPTKTAHVDIAENGTIGLVGDLLVEQASDGQSVEDAAATGLLEDRWQWMM